MRQTIFPLTRIHMPTRVDVEVENGVVTDAWISSTLFRGFEPMLAGRDPHDAALFTQRICGICSSAHAVTAAFALQAAWHVHAPTNGQYLTNLIQAADMMQNHLRQFYLMALADFAPVLPGPTAPAGLKQLTPDDLSLLQNHLKEGLRMSALAHELMTIFGGKAPHQQTITPYGVTEHASSERITAYWSRLQELRNWVSTAHREDVALLAHYYPEYYQVGRGYGRFLSFGLFPEPPTGKLHLPALTTAQSAAPVALQTSAIEEGTAFSWYQDDTPDRDKPAAYSWIKAPRYQGQAVEGGPLARAWLDGRYQRGISVLDRITARLEEIIWLCDAAADWLQRIHPDGPTYLAAVPPDNSEGSGLTDAMRGPVLHRLTIRQGRIASYQIITPSTWNFSPRDEQGQRGPVEQALIGTPVADDPELLSVGRVIRSFDPCFSCAVHAISPSKA